MTTNRLSSRWLAQKLVILCVVDILCVIPCQVAESVHAADQSKTRPYTINVRVGLAILPVSVINHKKQAVAGLTRNNFQVYEDGRLQEISLFDAHDVPVTVGLVVDNSGSMQPKRAQVMAAALAFARSSNPNDRMFVVHFNEEVFLGLPRTLPFTSSLEQLRAALSKIRASGKTALYDGIIVALEHLEKGSTEREYLIVVSDGGDNASKHTLSDVLNIAKASNAAIYAVGIIDQNYSEQKPDVLKKIAKLTGGESFFPESVPEIVGILERIAREIRQQYTIGYIPTNRSYDGRFRSIRVVVDAPGYGRLRVRTRAGYLAPVAAVGHQERSSQ